MKDRDGALTVVAILLIIGVTLFACARWWPDPSSDRQDILLWHEHQRAISDINLRWLKKCEAKHETFGLDQIGDISCQQPIAPKSAPIALPAEK